MVTPSSSFALLLVTLTICTSLANSSRPPFNISHFIYPKISDEFRTQPSQFLEDVLGSISDSEDWRLEDVRVSKSEVGKVRYGTLQRYEFRVPFGKSDLVLGLWDRVTSWKEFVEVGGDFESLVNGVSSDAVLNSFQAEGPFELIVDGDHELSLTLPLNRTFTGLKRILVGEDITVEVENAQKVSLFHTSYFGPQANKSLMINREQSEFWSVSPMQCIPLLPIRILGSASVVAYKNRSPSTRIASALRSWDTIELLPQKCYPRNSYKKQKCPLESLRKRLSMLEKLLQGLGDNVSLSVFKAKFEASTVFRFQLELERDIRRNDTRWTTMAEWRTKPTVEREWFEVLARVEMKRLKPLIFKKVRPFVGVDSSAWSNLMSNISFTKFPSILVPPEALTLDVKW